MAEENVSKLFFLDRDRIPIPFGMPNVGGTCWFAATFQFMASMPCVLRWLEIVREVQTPPKNKREKLAVDLRELTFEAISKFTPEHASEKTPPTTLNARVLMRQLAAVSAFQGHQLFSGPVANQDASEGFRIYVESLSDSLPEGVPELFAYLNYDEEIWLVCPRCQARTTPQISTGLHMSLVEPEGDFTTRVRRQKSVVNDWMCSSCKTKGKGLHFRVLKIIREGFVFISNKYERAVEFPKSFEIKLKDSEKSAVYQRVAYIEHQGGFNMRTGGGGHYFTVGERLDEDGSIQEFILNDASVHKIKKSEKTTKGSYMIAYHLTTLR